MSKTPGGQAASDKFLKKDAAKHGLGANNAPGHTPQQAPGEAPVASDSYNSNIGINKGASNIPGEKGNVGRPVGEKPGNVGTYQADWKESHDT